MCTSLCVAAMNSKPGCKLLEEREGWGGGQEGEGSGAVTDAIAIKEEGAEEKMFQSRETGGWAWGAAPRGGGRVWHPSQPGCLATDQLTLEKASSLEQD